MAKKALGDLHHIAGWPGDKLNERKSQVFVVMGVSGAGKTTVGRALAARLNCPFHEGSRDLILERLRARRDHYMKPEMLLSQFDALEPPDTNEAFKVCIDASVDEMVTKILAA